MPIKIALKKESNSTKFTTGFHNFSVAGLCFIYTSQIYCIDLFLTYYILHCYISENFVCLQWQPPLYLESQQLKDYFRDSNSQSKTNNFNELTMSNMCVHIQPICLHKHTASRFFLSDFPIHTQQQSTILHQICNFLKTCTKRNRL